MAFAAPPRIAAPASRSRIATGTAVPSSRSANRARAAWDPQRAEVVGADGVPHEREISPAAARSPHRDRRAGVSSLQRSNTSKVGRFDAGSAATRPQRAIEYSASRLAVIRSASLQLDRRHLGSHRSRIGAPRRLEARVHESVADQEAGATRDLRNHQPRAHLHARAPRGYAVLVDDSTPDRTRELCTPMGANPHTGSATGTSHR